MADPTLKPFRANEQAAVVPFFFMHEGEECVRLQIAGETRFSPVFRAVDLWMRDGLEEILYKDRFREQYQQFKEGNAQIADGTPLDEAPFLNPSRIAELRQLKIYSIEALANLDDRNIPRLGGKGYELKHMAQEFLKKKFENGANDKIAAMAAQIEALQNALNGQYTTDAEPARAVFNDPLSESPQGEYTRLKEEIKAKTGSYPRGNPSLETLQRIVAELGEE